MGLEPIEYRGELVALVGADRFHLIAPRLLACPAGDAELRFVTFMCVCYWQATEAGLTGQLSGDVLERWARHALIDERELLASSDMPGSELARRLHVPVAEVIAAREEIGAGQRVCPEQPSS